MRYLSRGQQTRQLVTGGSWVVLGRLARVPRGSLVRRVRTPRTDVYTVTMVTTDPFQLKWIWDRFPPVRDTDARPHSIRLRPVPRTPRGRLLVPCLQPTRVSTSQVVVLPPRRPSRSPSGSGRLVLGPRLLGLYALTCPDHPLSFSGDLSPTLVFVLPYFRSLRSHRGTKKDSVWGNTDCPSSVPPEVGDQTHRPRVAPVVAAHLRVLQSLNPGSLVTPSHGP